MDIMLPTLRAERAATYSPVLPVSPKSGIVLQVPIVVVDAEAGIVRFEDEGRNDRAVDPSPAAQSCNGRSTGRCAGSRSASIMKCTARI
jgi:lysyl-tRNA synthetase class I